MLIALPTPLIRKEGVAKTVEILSKAEIPEHFREASWEEALDLTVKNLVEIRNVHGGKALADFSSAKGSNEEAHLFQKLVWTGFCTNNVDHCTRLCHASSVAALLETLGSGTVLNPVADVIIVIGAKPTVNHPVAAIFMKNAAVVGKTPIIMDPYRSDIARHANYFLQFRPDTDVPMLNSLMYTIIDEGLQNEEYITRYTEGFEDLKNTVANYSPEKVSAICCIPAESLKEVARVYAASETSMIFLGVGVAQHIHGTDNARCLVSLTMLTWQIGRRGTGFTPLTGSK